MKDYLWLVQVVPMVRTVGWVTMIVGRTAITSSAAILSASKWSVPPSR